MDIDEPAEATTVRNEVRAWLELTLPAGWFEPGFTMTTARRQEFIDGWPALLRDGGWVCASWPVEYGGRGLSPLQTVAMAEEFARARVPMRVSSLGELLVGPTILHWGTPGQQAEFLPPILRGEHVWCQGFSEPGSGSDLASLQTTATRDGNQWVVSGDKIWTSEAEDADWCFLLARTDPSSSRHRGISYLLVPMDQPGVTVHPVAQPDGTRGFNRVVFDRARCEADHVVGGEGNGWRVAMTTLGFERATSATTGYHRFRAELDELVASAQRLGRADDPVLRQELARAHCRVEIMRMSGYRMLTAAVQERHDSGVEALTATNKLYWTRHSADSTDLALQVLGPAGQVLTGTDHDERPAPVGLGRREPLHHYPASPLQLLWLFSRGESIYGGTSEIQRNIVAERVLRLPSEPRPD